MNNDTACATAHVDAIKSAPSTASGREAAKAAILCHYRAGGSNDDTEALHVMMTCDSWQTYGESEARGEARQDGAHVRCLLLREGTHMTSCSNEDVGLGWLDAAEELQELDKAEMSGSLDDIIQAMARIKWEF